MLTTGTKLGPYEILSPAGAGGMGEVYRARDLRLDRTVAVKVLSTHVSTNPDLKQRFEREARAISSLNHPHICHLYDVGSQNGTDFLVMEFVEGQTLAQRLEKGPLPLDEALRVGVEIADALDKAHRQSIVHRDLKPGNIMLTKAGAKLMDFGLAKPAVGAPGTSLSPVPITPSTPTVSLGALALSTAPEPLTKHGTIVGTFQYMAPEVLQGADADARSDIFSFGCVLYEMITGRKAFEGKSQISVLAAILEKEPESIAVLQPSAPVGLQFLICACLAKDPAERIQSAHDLKLDIQLLRTAAPAAIEAGSARRKWHWLLGGAAGLVVLVIAAALGWWLHPASPAAQSAPVMQLSITMPEGVTLSPLEGPVISPDASAVVFVGRDKDGTNALYVRRLDTPVARRLEGTEMATYPFWSPDSGSIGFFAQGQLRRMDMATGFVQAIADASDGRGGAWNRDGMILFTPHASAPLYRVSASGGKPEQVTDLGGTNSHRWPSFLADGRHFVFTMQSGTAPGGIFIASLDDPHPHLLSKEHFNCQVVNDYLLFTRGSALVAAKLDLKTATLGAETVLVAEHVRTVPDRNFAEFSAANNGVLAYTSGDANNLELGWFARDGRQLAKIDARNLRGEMDLSRDGRRLLSDHTSSSGDTEIDIVDLERNAASPVMHAAKTDSSAVWSPTGESVAVGSDREGQSVLVRKWIDGSAREQILARSPLSLYPDDWSRDGRWLLYEHVAGGGKQNFDLMLLDLTSGKDQAYLATSADEAHGRISPDERWVAYVSDESGPAEVYIQSFPATGGGKWQVSTNGGDQPYWRADGKELYYMAPDSSLMAVSLRSGKSLDPAAPIKLFNTRSVVAGPTGARNFFVAAPDGKRFLIEYVADQPGGGSISVVMNWQGKLTATRSDSLKK